MKRLQKRQPIDKLERNAARNWIERIRLVIVYINDWSQSKMKTYIKALSPGFLLDARGEFGKFRLVPHDLIFVWTM